ncbi:hypothetical protein EDD21DRAFT_357702 [Dissophora ornata]|nr:hypothetical protein EDD21DRAFT_357702 [Dissophora ornata]
MTRSNLQPTIDPWKNHRPQSVVAVIEAVFSYTKTRRTSTIGHHSHMYPCANVIAVANQSYTGVLAARHPFSILDLGYIHSGVAAFNFIFLYFFLRSNEAVSFVLYAFKLLSLNQHCELYINFNNAEVHTTFG